MLPRLTWSRTPTWRVNPVEGLDPQRSAQRDDDLATAAPTHDDAWAERAVRLRLAGRDAEAREALGHISPAGFERLADARLTRAFYTALDGDFARAFDDASPVLATRPALDPGTPVLAATLARWSMARGPEGLGPAITLLSTRATVGPLSDPERCTLVAALVRARREPEAAALASQFSEQLQPFAGDVDAWGAGLLTEGEGPASVGIALLLGGRAREAEAPLERALAVSRGPWVEETRRWLARARRAPERRP
ncbi:MAG: hypothetical protein JNK72_09365 [Myxococcales bacterium]|nr:hypothetical protein [Myxococcales bacterium]